jgi:hypothetical protein
MFVIVWNDETEGVSGVTGPYETQMAAVVTVRDYIEDVFTEENIWNDVLWWGGWKITCELGDVTFAEILSLDEVAYS